jgi:acetoacetate decarboxylase
MTNTELRGYTLPLSPSGTTALVAPPPWHFAGDVLMVEFLMEPAVLQGLLPKGLTPDEDDPRGAVIVGDWQSLSQDQHEVAEPLLGQYREFYIALKAKFNGEAVVRSPFCWVDKDFSLLRGHIQGYPKKLGEIGMTRSFPVGQASPRIDAGGIFRGTLSSAGYRLASIGVTLERAVAEPPELMTAPLAHSRIFPQWAPGGAGVCELVTGGSTDQQVSEVWAGQADLSFFDSPHDELSRLRPVEVLDGYRFSFSETLTGGKLLSDDGR